MEPVTLEESREELCLKSSAPHNVFACRDVTAGRVPGEQHHARTGFGVRVLIYLVLTACFLQVGLTDPMQRSA